MSSVWQRPRSSRRIHDFRTSAWYVSAATSPKDVVILVDNSGSMTEKRAEIARAIVEKILDTLTDNDFVNVFKFSDITEETVPCTKDSLLQVCRFASANYSYIIFILLQANAENILLLKDSLSMFRAENIANFTSALITGFEILQKVVFLPRCSFFSNPFLLQYNRTGQGCQCNQAIMLITDGPNSNYQDVYKTYNFPHRPVRIFTYLVGKDSSGADEMHWMACENKGWNLHIWFF